MNSDVAETYLRFVAERHKIWERRQAGAPGPWTTDPILATRKFTNIFRILDPGTQFLLTDLFVNGLSERNTLMRAFLYRHTGRIDTWRYLDLIQGYPTVAELPAVLAAWEAYRGTPTVTIRGKEARNAAGGTKVVYQRSIFTGAYLVFPQSTEAKTDKLVSIVNLTRRLFTPGSPDDVMPAWTAARTQQERFRVLRRNPGVGDFMSMQILTDWTYQCGQDLEQEFVVPGPGAIKGARAIFGDTLSPLKAIHWAQEALEIDPPQLALPSGALRSPSLMDVQNSMCEFSKYVRYQSAPARLSVYPAAHPGAQVPPTLPSHW